MKAAGAIALVTGAAGIAAFIALTAASNRLRPPRAVSITLLSLLMVLTCAGLVLLTIAGAGGSLHTGG